jgi:spore germination protein KC
MGTSPSIKAVKVIVLLLVAVPFLTGCWDRLEIEERAVVLGISVDRADPEAEEQEEEVSHLQEAFPAPDKDMIRVAVAIALPGRIQLGPGESGGGSAGGEQTLWVIDVVGHTIDDAIMNLQQQISGRLFFGHLRVIVVSEEVARKGLQNLNDYFRRNSEVRRMAWMMISKGPAEELMKSAPRLERVPTLYLMSTLDNAVKLGKFPFDYVGMFWSNTSKKGQEAFLPYVELMKDDNIEIEGLAYFQGPKMVGSTKPFEIAGYMGIKGLNPAGYRGFVKIEGAEETVTIYATNRKSQFELQIREGLPHFTVTVFTEINLEEKMNEHALVINSDILKKIEQQNAESLVKTYEELIKKTQEKGSDIYGFGEYVRAKEPRYWNQQIRTKERWQEMFQDITVEFKVSTNIRRVGMKAQ